MKQFIPHDVHKERGVVSVLSVIFFIILMSILSISFLRIVTDEQEQVIQDDLSKGALAAAQSGVEDAKRALLHCARLSGPQRAACYTALNNQTCPGIFSDPTLVNDLGLTANRQADGSIRVGDATNNNNQRYTCVTLSQDTPNYTGILSEGLGDFIPLRSVGLFNQIRISWHQTSVDGAAAIPPAGQISLNSNPRRPAWQNGGGTRYIAMPRLQLMRFDPTQPLSALRDSSSGTFLVPYNSGAGNSTVAVSSITAAGMPKRAAVNCNNPGPVAGYRCTATLTLPAIPATSQLYLLLRSQYSTPHYQVELLNNGTPVSFNNVQPLIDSTGVTANVYKRVLTRVRYQADTFFTTNAIEAGTAICKNFFVTNSLYQDECVNIFNPPANGGANIGGYCSVNVCIPVNNASGGSPQWSVTMVNLSDNDPSDVQGCLWDFGDGSTSNTHCNRNDTFTHNFPPDPAYDTNPNLPKKSYTVTLTVYLDNGSQYTTTRVFWLPENYP